MERITYKMMAKRSKSESDLTDLLEEEEVQSMFSDDEQLTRLRNIKNAIDHFKLLDDEKLNEPDILTKMFTKWTVMDFVGVTKIGCIFHKFVTENILNDTTSNFSRVFELTENTSLYSTYDAKTSIITSLMDDFDARHKFNIIDRTSESYMLSHPYHLKEMFADWTFLDLLHLNSFNVHFYPVVAYLIEERCTDFTSIADVYSIRKAFKMFGKFMTNIKISPYKLQHRRSIYPFEEVIRLIRKYCCKEKLRKITFDCFIRLDYTDDEDHEDHLYDLENDKTLKMLTKFMTSFEVDSAKIMKFKIDKKRFSDLHYIERKLTYVAIENNCHELILTIVVEIDETNNFLIPQSNEGETQPTNSFFGLISLNVDCFIEIFKKLDFSDLLHLSELNSDCHDIIVNHVIGKKLLKFSEIKSHHSIRKAFELYGKAMTRLDISNRDLQYVAHSSSLDEVLGLISHHCAVGKLTEITFRNFDADRLTVFTTNSVLEHFKSVKLLRVILPPLQRLLMNMGVCSMDMLKHVYCVVMSRSSDAVMEVLDEDGKVLVREDVEPFEFDNTEGSEDNGISEYEVEYDY